MQDCRNEANIAHKCQYRGRSCFLCVEHRLYLNGFITKGADGRLGLVYKQDDKDQDDNDKHSGEDTDGNNHIGKGPLKDIFKKGFNDELLNVVLRIGCNQ